jgi:aerobic carbon-monoxide dehydrogenase large subunit
MDPVGVGSRFSVRGEAYPEYGALMLAAKLLDRPVQWVSCRSQDFVNDFRSRATVLNGEVTLDDREYFWVARFSWVVNSGAFLSQPCPIMTTATHSTHAAGLYPIPTFYEEHKLVLTNTAPTTAYRGAAQRCLPA